MNQKSLTRPLVCTLAILAALLAFSWGAHAHPYASAVTNDNGTIRFIMNEAGANVDVVFEDSTTNAMGVLPKGATNFSLGAHSSYQIICTKLGNGTPALISSDTFSNSIWANPRGIAVNKNPKRGELFGRIYAGSGGTGGFAFGTPGFKAHGIYAMNADQTTALGQGTNAFAQPTFANSGTSGPWKMRVALDDSLLVTDFSTAAAAFWQFAPDLSSSNLLLAVIGQTAGVAAGIHGDPFGTPTITGSLFGGDLKIWTAEGRLPAPATALLGPGTAPGDANCVFRYDVGTGPIPASGWNNPPNYAYTMGLQGIPGLRTEMDIAPDGKIICGFGRANLSNPNIQILTPSGDTLLYTSGVTPPANVPPASDPWNGVNGAGAAVGTYNGVRMSSDGRYFASVDLQSGITLASVTNGIPDEGSIFGIANPPASGTLLGGGMDWDAADNVYVASGNQSIIRIYSLGLSTTCITSNDFTGTNGSFNLFVPPFTAAVVATTKMASQNYGTPTPGVFTITLNTNSLTTNLTVNFARSGTAVLTNHYNFNYGTNADGVVISSNSVIFPPGAWPHAGNWSVAVQVIPTPIPVSTNTLTVIMGVSGGAAYLAGAPARDTVYIQNTGPQLLILAAAPAAPSAGGTSPTMYRGVTNDYAKFIITRLGDTNGPGNSFGSVTPKSYTVTNVTYFGTAVYPTDYGARAQRIDPAGDGIIVPPVDGPTAIVINPGDSVVTCIVGNPKPHTNLSAPPTNLTIVVNLTNAVACPACTNLTSSENYPYIVGANTATLTEIDNAIGPEIVLWSNPLISEADSVNWTLTFAATDMGPNPQLPAVVPNYVNDATSLLGGGSNDFNVKFGYDVTSDSVLPSPVMLANGWTNALKMTVNKLSFAQAGVNVYPQGQNFFGNYALRFNMFLSLYQFASNNPNIGTAAREFALFGVNHRGTNTNWRTAAPIPAGAGNSPTNSDGQWFAIDAGSGSITPADFDAFVPEGLPNAGVPNDKVSNTALSQNGVFKHPPFEAMNVLRPTVANPGGGEPVNKWVDVNVELRQTNISVFINRSQVLSPFPLTNGSLATTYTNGTIMLGYLDPNADISDNSAFVYFSNVRVVELSPYILLQPGLINSLTNRLIVAQGSSLTFTSSATFASAPITNIWYRGTGLAGGVTNGTPTAALQTNSANATSMTDTLTRTFNSIVDATNYMSVFSDAAGSVTSRVVAVEVVFGPTNQTYNGGVTSNLLVAAAGPLAPTAFQWYFNTVSNLGTATKLTNSTHYAGVTSSNLFLTNIVAGDAGFYWTAVTNAAGFLIPEAAVLTVSVSPGPSSVVVTPASQTILWGSNASFTVSASGTAPFTYQWKKGGVNLGNGGNVSGATSNVLTLASVTTADQATYTAGVTNAFGGAISSSGVLTILVPPPTISGVSASGGNLTLTITSPNSFDTTNAFILQTSPVVTGPYTNTPATITGLSGSFQIIVPQTGATMFYRLLHAN